MPDFYASVPVAWWNTNVSPLADGAKVTIGNGVEIHRADGPLPESIVTALGTFKLLRCSDPAEFTAASGGSGPVLTGLTRVDATSTTTTTATATAYPISAATGTHLLVSITARTSDIMTGGTVTINGGPPVTATSTGGGQYTQLWAVVPNPGGSTMDIVVTRGGSTGTFGTASDTSFYIWNMSATGQITASAQNSKDIATTDTTFSVSLNVPSNGAVAAIFHPRFTDGLTPSLAVLTNVDVDASQSTAAGTLSRIWASRDGLAANAAYVIDTTVRRSNATPAAFGAVVIGP